MEFNVKAMVAMAVAGLLLAMSFAVVLGSEEDVIAERVKRQNAPAQGESSSSEPESGSGHAESETPPSSGGGVSLGKILGIAFLACCIIYCIGISWKVYKVCKGTYVEEEPVFLKYK